MESKITLLGHPLHAMLVVFPLGLLFTSFLFDLIYLSRRDPFWRRAAFWLVLVGTAGALASVATGLFDYLSIPMPPHARDTATTHLFLGLAVTVLYGLQVWLRRRDAGARARFSSDEEAARLSYSPALLLLALISVMTVGVQGWLGGEVSHVHGVGVVAERKRPDAMRLTTTTSEDTPSVVSGQEVYRRVCAGCHGDKAQGGVGPRLAGGESPYELEEIVKIVRVGQPPLMPSFGKELTSEELGAVAAYAYSLMKSR